MHRLMHQGPRWFPYMFGTLMADRRVHEAAKDTVRALEAKQNGASQAESDATAGESRDSSSPTASTADVECDQASHRTESFKTGERAAVPGQDATVQSSDGEQQRQHDTVQAALAKATESLQLARKAYDEAGRAGQQTELGAEPVVPTSAADEGSVNDYGGAEESEEHDDFGEYDDSEDDESEDDESEDGESERNRRDYEEWERSTRSYTTDLIYHFLRTWGPSVALVLLGCLVGLVNWLISKG